MINDQLRKVIDGVSSSTGENFFLAITSHLNEIIGADYTFIARVNNEKTQAKTIAISSNNSIIENFSYLLKNTPCERVADNNVCFYPSNVSLFFPDDHLLKDMNIEAYIGTPLVDSKGQVIGLIVGLFENVVPSCEQTKLLFQLLSGRVAAELQRYDYEERLLLINSQLEDLVESRTAELRSALVELQMAQNKLIESKKMASLGVLVSGIAHEINTPLGIAITSITALSERLGILNKKFSSKNLISQDLVNFNSDAVNHISLITNSLSRAATLVENFKLSSTDQHSDENRLISIKEYYQLVVSTLNSFLEKNKLQLRLSPIRI